MNTKNEELEKKFAQDDLFDGELRQEPSAPEKSKTENSNPQNDESHEEKNSPGQLKETGNDSPQAQAATKGKYSLTIREKCYWLADGEYLVGSGPDADIPIENDDYVSSKHLKLIVKDDSLQVADAGSRNGVFRKLEGVSEIADGFLLAGKTLMEIKSN